MTVIRQPIGALSLDAGPRDGEHLWVAQDVLLQDGGYEKMPEWSEGYTQSTTSGHSLYGIHSWRGGVTGRAYLATDDKFFEMTDSGATDVTGSTTPTTDNTNGVKFASYGEWVFAANGVNKIQTMKVPSATGSATNFEDMVYTTGGAKISPKYICSHKNHIVAADIKFAESYGEIATATTGVGSAFTNQPTNTGVKFVTTDPGDNHVYLVMGTRSGQGDTVTAVSGTLTAPGTTTIANSDWNKILGITLGGVAVAAIAVQRTSDSAGIVTFGIGAAAAGVYNVPAADQAAGDRVIDLVASVGSTRQVGIVGTTPGGVNTYDSQALNGTTTVQSNSEFRSIQNILIGDIEVTDTVTFTSHQYPANYTDPYLVWWSGTDDPEGYGTEVLAPQIAGSSNQPLLDGVGKITGIADGGDCFFVFKEGSIYRFDGPPFQPTVISYSVGMKAGLLPYRQGNRIYFWSEAGLHFIDISNNQVNPTMTSTVQRSVLDYANANYQSTVGSYPLQRVSTKHLANCVNTGNLVTISGDSANSLVVLMFKNASQAGGHGMVYHEATGAFTMLTGPSGSNMEQVQLVDYRPGSGQIPGSLSSLRMVFKKTATLLSWTKPLPTGYTEAGTRDSYFRWPFKGAAPGGPTTRVARVKPIFDNPSTATTQNMNIHVCVYSISGVGKSWYLHSVLSIGNATTSLDGWITIDGCPFAERHSIGVSFLANGTTSNPDPRVSGFVGIDVDVVSGTSKGI